MLRRLAGLLNRKPDVQADADRAVALVTKNYSRGSLVWMADFDGEALRFFYPGWSWPHYREVLKLTDLKLRERGHAVELAPITVSDYRSFIDTFMGEDTATNRQFFLSWRLKADQLKPPGPLRRQFKPLSCVDWPTPRPKTTFLGPMAKV